MQYVHPNRSYGTNRKPHQLLHGLSRDGVLHGVAKRIASRFPSQGGFIAIFQRDIKISGILQYLRIGAVGITFPFVSEVLRVLECHFWVDGKRFA